jgi:hypothetical protein
LYRAEKLVEKIREKLDKLLIFHAENGGFLLSNNLDVSVTTG